MTTTTKTTKGSENNGKKHKKSYREIHLTAERKK